MSNLKKTIKEKIDRIPETGNTLTYINMLIDHSDQLEKVIRELKLPGSRPVSLMPKSDKNVTFVKENIDLNKLPDASEAGEKSIRQLVKEFLDEVAMLEKEYHQIMTQ